MKRLSAPIHFTLFFIVSFVLLVTIHKFLYDTLLIDLNDVLYAILLFVCSIPVHEVIHGITCCCVSDNTWRTIRIGVDIKKFTFYCKYRDSVKTKSESIAITLMPMLLLAVIPGFAILYLNNSVLVIFSALSFGGASNDIYKACKLIIEKKN